MKFVQLANSLKEELAPVYLVEGEEAYFRDHAVSSIVAACGLKQPTLNYENCDGEALKGEKLKAFQEKLRVLPFFDERRVIRVNEFHPTERDYESYFNEYALSPCPTTVLIIVNSQKKANCAELKKKKGITFVDCAREDEEMLSRWLFSLMRREGLAPEVDAATLMVRYCAQDAARMKLETEKLKQLLGEGGRVTCAVVEENVAKDTEYKIYELTQAASRKNFNLFLQILYDVKNKGMDEYAILAALLSHYKTLLEISVLKGSDAEVAKTLGVKPFAVQKNREIVSRLGAERIREVYEKLFELSCGSKSGKFTKFGAFEAAIAKILFD